MSYSYRLKKDNLKLNEIVVQGFEQIKEAMNFRWLEIDAWCLVKANPVIHSLYYGLVWEGLFYKTREGNIVILLKFLKSDDSEIGRNYGFSLGAIYKRITWLATLRIDIEGYEVCKRNKYQTPLPWTSSLEAFKELIVDM